MQPQVRSLQLLLAGRGPEGRAQGGQARGTSRCGTALPGAPGSPGGTRPLSRQVTGEVTDPTGKVHFLLLGTWDEKMDCYKVAAGSGDNGVEARQRAHEAEDSRMLLWKRNPLP